MHSSLTIQGKQVKAKENKSKYKVVAVKLEALKNKTQT